MKIHLCSGWDSVPVSLVFGELANLAWPIVEHYRSDLYHDAQWLETNLEVGKPFYYSVRPTGTDISTLPRSNNLHYHRCELTLEDATHYLTITEETN